MEPKATVVSILPFEIYDSKPNLYPGNFTIPAGKINQPGLLIVSRSHFFVPMAFGAQSLMVHSSSFEVANSIVNDYVGALLGISEDCRPGLFVVNSAFKDVEEAAVALLPEIQRRVPAQRNWFHRLVQMADAEYKRHMQAESISDLQKMAARELNLKDRPWMVSLDQLSINNCPACYTPVNSNAIICPSCRYVINPSKYDPKMFAVSIGTPQPQNVG